MKTILGRPVLHCLCVYLLCANARAQSMVTTIAGGRLPQSGAQAVAEYIDSPGSIVADGAGGFYFGSENQRRVYRVDASGTLFVVAGNGVYGNAGDGGPATAAQLEYVSALAIDTAGNLYIGQSRRVRKVTPEGVIDTAVLSPIVDDSLPQPLGFQNISGLAIDGAGNIVISDAEQNHVLNVSPDGTMSRIAGNGFGGFSGDNGPATSATLRRPLGLAIDPAGNLFIADAGNYRIRKVTPSGTITTVAGNGVNVFAGEGGFATSASLSSLRTVAVDDSGNLYIAVNFRVLKVDVAGIIRTVAGTSSYGFSGDGGLATAARLSFTISVTAPDSAGNIFVADTFNLRVRKVDNSGVINTVAGTSQPPFVGDGGLATDSLLIGPQGVAVDETGTFYIADTGNNRIRRVTPQGVIETIAGTGTPGFGGDAGPAALALFNGPSNVILDHGGDLLILDACNSRLRRIGLDGIITTFANTEFGNCAEDEGPAGQIAIDNASNVYVAAPVRHLVRVFPPGGGSRTLAGGARWGFSGDGGPATLAQLSFPMGVAVDASGNVFIADYGNDRIRRVSPDGTITTFAGTGVAGFTGDGGPASEAQLYAPSALTFDRAGNLFIAGGNRVRKVTPAGIITSVADGGPATEPQFGSITSITTDSFGNVYIADPHNNRIRKVALSFDPPTIASVSPNRLSRGATLDVTFTGGNLVPSMTIDAGNDIVVSNVRSFGTWAVATLAISSSAELGPRPVSVATSAGTVNSSPVTILPPVPDLSITSSHIPNFVAGFDSSYTVSVLNVGGATATSPFTVVGALPSGLTYLSGSGTGWVCTPGSQTISCMNDGTLPAGTSTTLALSVTVHEAGLPSFVHSVTVSSAEDVVDDNNAFSERTAVAQPPAVNIEPLGMFAGTQGRVRVSLASPIPRDVTGTVSVAFTSSAVIQADDPAIQFETGGRQTSFTVPANTLFARFNTERPEVIGIQTGTVSGSLTFTGELNTGLVRQTFSSVAVIPNQPPIIRSIRSNATALSLTLFSTAREVTQIVLEFKTTPTLQLGCGPIPGCTVSGSTLRFDVRPLFEDWYRSDTTYGSLATLTLPWAIKGSVRGSVSVTLRNSQGQAISREAPIP